MSFIPFREDDGIRMKYKQVNAKEVQEKVNNGPNDKKIVFICEY